MLFRSGKKFFILNQNYIDRQKLLSTDLMEISSLLNSLNIDSIVLKGMALNAENLYESNTRYCKDIDILVRKDQLSAAYQALKKIGYSYYYSDTQDSSNFVYMHHLPVLVNENGTTVELHWRITDVALYKDCPATNYFFKYKKKSQLKNTFIPSYNCMLIHAIYHGVIHHNLDDKVTLLFDIHVLEKAGTKQIGRAHV